MKLKGKTQGDRYHEFSPDGTVKQRRFYGPDGKATRDVDYNHGGVGHKFPHGHEWDWNKTPPRQGDNDFVESIISGAIVGGLGYGAYRALRMIPSLLFPPSIIPNAIAP